MAEREEEQVPDETAPDVSEPAVAGTAEGAARPPLDEDAAWAELVAGFDDEPEPGTGSWPDAENLSPARPEDGAEDGNGDADAGSGPPTRSIVVHPVIKGPRDYTAAEDEDEGHYVPPEPPPLPQADVTTKFAWLAVLGGPLLLIVFILLRQEITWWVMTLGVGGFVGGFCTLVTRLRTGEDDDELPGGGAVV
ncbi:hypothetical protein ABZ721_36990 [Streptomyces sp. NPDC006733]|uniref:hypothetical protein n=1 Tax=Streptomyces sp. NPDC006733 TaxID=3155460 RepID=UPI0034053A11